jgi:hypothetical protein
LKSPLREAARKASTSRWRGLPRRRRGTLDDGRDLVEGDGEQVVQHEREPLGGRQRVEHYEQRGAHRVGQHRLAFGVHPVDRVGHVLVQQLLTPRPARLQHVETDAGDDRGQPATQVLHATGAGAAEPHPGILDRVVGLGKRAEHAGACGSASYSLISVDRDWMFRSPRRQ